MKYVFNFSWLSSAGDALVSGAYATLVLTLVACLGGSLIGVVIALGRNSERRALRVVVGTYVEGIRNTPLLVQAFLIFFGLPSIGIVLTPMVAAGVALTVNCGAYTAEIFRAGFDSIRKSQHEAASSLNLTRYQTFVYVILPQALRNIYPSLSGQFVLILMASSITSQISAEELSAAASQLQSTSFRGFEVYAVASLIYFLLVMALKSCLAIVGNKWLGTPGAVSDARGAKA